MSNRSDACDDESIQLIWKGSFLMMSNLKILQETQIGWYLSMIVFVFTRNPKKLMCTE